MTPYEYMLGRIEAGFCPTVLGDCRAPSGGVPTFCMPIRTSDGRIIPPGQHLFHPDPRIRMHAHIGLAVGAHREWAMLGMG